MNFEFHCTGSPKNVSPNPALLHALKRIKAEEDKHSENGSMWVKFLCKYQRKVIDNNNSNNIWLAKEKHSSLEYNAKIKMINCWWSWVLMFC
jgi:hypothetical protein